MTSAAERALWAAPTSGSPVHAVVPVPGSKSATNRALILASLADGPYCGSAPYRFDADLYRVRRVHVRLRVQPTSARLRAPGRALGLALHVPDMVVEFDVAPRSLQLRRGGS